MSLSALVIASDPATAEDLIGLLRPLDLFDPFHIAADLPQALDVLRREPIMMLFAEVPHSTRAVLEVSRQLRGRDDWSELPLLVFVREENPGLRILALEVGAGDCVSFKCSATELALRCRRQLEAAERVRLLRQGQARLARLALTDGLTGVFNRAYFDATLEQEIARRNRAGHPLALLLLDLDHFKWINDRFGHSAGDQVLRDVAQIISRSFRKSDTVCRYGGEEFAVILPETAQEQAYLIAERVRRAISQNPLPYQVTASIGLGWAAGPGKLHPQMLIDRADTALYAAKNDGRNRTEVWVEGLANAGESCRTVGGG